MVDKEREGESSLIICKGNKIDSLPVAYRGYVTALLKWQLVILILNSH